MSCWCSTGDSIDPFCVQQLGQLRGDYDKLNVLNAEILTIAVEDYSRPDLAARAQEYPFPMLYDADGDVTRAYEVYRVAAAEAIPSVFIVDRSGSVVWKQVGSTYHRTSNSEIIAQLEKLS